MTDFGIKKHVFDVFLFSYRRRSGYQICKCYVFFFLIHVISFHSISQSPFGALQCVCVPLGVVCFGVLLMSDIWEKTAFLNLNNVTTYHLRPYYLEQGLNILTLSFTFSCSQACDDDINLSISIHATVAVCTVRPSHPNCMCFRSLHAGIHRILEGSVFIQT